jgi:glycosyltransferase A (GT-A) superfamily protein (DUF2064 family)
VLIGARAIQQCVFQNIPFGSRQVYTQTVAALKESGLSWTRLPALADIDRPEDLPAWDTIKREAQAGVS